MVVSATYAATTWRNFNARKEPGASALAKGASLPEIVVLAAVAAGAANRFADHCERARRTAVRNLSRLAAEQEHRRHQRFIHDSVLQTLEAMAAGLVGDEAAMQTRARSEALALRASLDERSTAKGVHARFVELAGELEANAGLRIDVLADELSSQPSPDVSRALLAAAREALINVAKHAGVTRAVLRLRPRDNGIEVVVTDRGKGFEMATTRAGFGTTQSIRARLAEVGGRAELWSRLGMGTRASLWGPLR
jgi:signal transduction histidine kinase